MAGERRGLLGTTRRQVGAIAAAVVVGMTLGPAAADAASDATKNDVRVTNTESEAVPTKVVDPVSLADGTTVGATQSGPWSVSVSDLPEVQVQRPEPFQRYFIMSVDGGQRCETAGITLVEDGIRLVITSINVHMYPITGVGVRAWVQARRADGSFANIHVPLEKQAYHDDVNDRDDYVGVVETSLVHEGSYPFFVTICMSQVAPGGPSNSLGVFQGTVLGHTEQIA